jgi:hypothetical protein
MRPPSSVLPAPRSVILGPADVGDDELDAFAAADLGVQHATVLTSSAEVFPYDRPAITTAGRYLVTGSARTGTGEVRAFSFFVKVIHSYERSPLRLAVPGHLRSEAAAFIPWRTEADLYRSDLRDRLPGGLTIPRAAAVRDLDADSAALWLEHIPPRRVTWDTGRHARAAYLLGRLAASRQYRSSVRLPGWNRSRGCSGPMPLAITITASRSASAGPQASANADPSEWASTANRPIPR